MAYNESHANTFVASIDGAHRLLGFIHAMYALGCLISPFVATAIAARVGNKWPLFYLYLVGIGILNALAVALAFRHSLQFHAKPQQPAIEGISQTPLDESSRRKTANRDVIITLKLPSVYLLSLFYFSVSYTHL